MKLSEAKRQVRRPIHVDKQTCFYVEPDGLSVVHEARDYVNGAHIQTDVFTIRWHSIERALMLREALKGENDNG
jgi:hypothetical protein